MRIWKRAISLLLIVFPLDLSSDLLCEFERLYRREPIVTQIAPVAQSLSHVPKLHFQLPLPRHLVSGWDYLDPRNPTHTGIDYACIPGESVHAAADGRVLFATHNGDCGLEVALIHAGGYRSYYCHLDSFANAWYVAGGDVIGYCGNTGASTGAHLHFEVHQWGVPIDPRTLP